MPGTLPSRYTLLEPIGGEAPLEIFEAKLKGPGMTQTVCVTRITPARPDPVATARFLEESRRARELAHTHVEQIFDAGESDGAWFLTTELLIGQPLSKILDAAPAPIPIGVAARIIIDASRGLEHAHAQEDGGLLHRDIWPGSLAVGYDGITKVTGFGLAMASSLATNTAPHRGRSPWASPEQAAGDPVDARSDLYSLGAVLRAIAPGAAIAGITPILERATAKERERRFPNVAAFGEALADWLEKGNVVGSSAAVREFLEHRIPP